MKTTLPTLSDFIYNHPASMDYEWVCGNFLEYNMFLRQPLKLEMFVPCKDGEPLEEPNNVVYLHDSNGNMLERYKVDYQKAKDRVIFKGFEIKKEKNYTVLTNGFISAAFIGGKGNFRFYYKSIQYLTNKVDLVDKEFKRLGL